MYKNSVEIRDMDVFLAVDFEHPTYFLENTIKFIEADGKYQYDENNLSVIIISNLRRLKNIEFAIDILI